MNSSATSDPPPRGADAVREALVRAARELLATMPAAGISGRDIARAAGVNYGLIHQYFGTKEAILREVFLRVSDDALSLADPDSIQPWWADPLRISAVPEIWRVVANMVSDPALMASIDWEFPLMRGIVDDLARARPDLSPTATQAHAALVGSVLLGWGLLQPIYQQGFELGDADLAALSERLFALIPDVVNQPSSLHTP